MNKTEITIQITDIRGLGKYGKYHNLPLKLTNKKIGDKRYLFCQYGKMTVAEALDGSIIDGRAEVHGVKTGKDGDIILGREKFRFALNQIGMDISEKDFTIINKA